MLYRLQPFAPTLFNDIALSLEILPSQENFTFLFRLEGSPRSLEHLVWPQSESPKRLDGLWQTTVFELFVSPRGATRYTEFNFAPSYDWNAYEFVSERKGMSLATSFQKNSIEDVTREASLVTLKGLIDFKDLKMQSPLELSATAVLDWGQQKEYWAIRHCGEKPDFHLRSSFVVQL